MRERTKLDVEFLPCAKSSSIYQIQNEAPTVRLISAAQIIPLYHQIVSKLKCFLESLSQFFTTGLLLTRFYCCVMPHRKLRLLEDEREVKS